MALISFLDFPPMKTYKQFTSKKKLATILGVGTVLLGALFLISPLVSTMAQQQQLQHRQFETNESIPNQFNTEPTINGSVSVGDSLVNFLKENTRTPFIAAAETAQQQITNGTVLGGHLGVTQGYLAYTYLVANPTDKTIHKVIIDAGNGQVLGKSEGTSYESFGQSRHLGFGHWKGHHGFFGGLFHNLPLGSSLFGSNSNLAGVGSW